MHFIEHIAYRWFGDQGVEVSLIQEVLRRLLGRRRFDGVRSVVPQDGRVDSIRETDIAKVRIGADPVVVHSLVRS